MDRRSPARVGAIVLAAGSGHRFGGQKQFELLTGSTRLVDRAIEAVRTVASSVVLVLPAETTWSGAPVTEVVVGGATRTASVAAGLAVLDADVDTVIVHDAAHPLASPDLCRRVVAGLDHHDAVVPFLPCADVIKARTEGNEGSLLKTVGKEGLGTAQVPMGFRTASLRRAHASAHATTVTEDSELIERAGGAVGVVQGEAANLHVVDDETMTLVRHLARVL